VILLYLNKPYLVFIVLFFKYIIANPILIPTAAKKIAINQFTPTRKNGLTRGSTKIKNTNKSGISMTADLTHLTDKVTSAQTSDKNITSDASGENEYDGSNAGNITNNTDMDLSIDKKINDHIRIDESDDDEREYKK
jgi:hypothetical protein